jgi:Protein of unknown function (DUF1566)
MHTKTHAAAHAPAQSYPNSKGTLNAMLVTVFSLLTTVTCFAACPSSPGRYTANGAEVTDTRTGLVWARCSAGQTWSGSACTGTASSYTHEGALSYAKAQASTTGVAWRLPSVKELASIADKGCQNPAIDSAAFPSTPSTWYWSSSPYVGDAGYAWSVSFGNGYVGNGYRYGNGAVRLVRASQ